MKLIVDSRENKDFVGKIAARTTPVIAMLGYGDIHIVDGDGHEIVVIERKTFQDLANSIRDDRNVSQMKKLSELPTTTRVAYLIERSNLTGMEYDYVLRSLTNKLVIHGFSILMTNGMDESVSMVLSIFESCKKKDEPMVKKELPKKIKGVENQFLRMLLTIDRLGMEKATQIVEKFTSQSAMLEYLAKNGTLGIPRLGSKTEEKIKKAFT